MQHNFQNNLCKLFDEYRKATGKAATTKEVAEWALQTGRVEVPEREQVAIVARKMQSAWSAERVTDKQGRTVRRKHAAEIMIRDEDGSPKQTFFWDNMEEANHEHMILSYSNRHSGIRDDVEALRTDVDSYNENWLPPGKTPIQMSFDFDGDDAAGAA